MSDELWSDDKIYNEFRYWVTPDEALHTVKQMRDDYAAKLAELEAKVNHRDRQLADVADKWARIRELEGEVVKVGTMAEMIGKCEIDATKANWRIAALEQELSKLKHANEIIRGENGNLIAENIGIRRELAELEQERDELQNALERSNQAVAHARSVAVHAEKYAIELEQERDALRAILAHIDKHAPLADDTCEEPGITLSEAARRCLEDERKESAP